MKISDEIPATAIKKEIGHRFKIARLNKNWSQKLLSEKSGVSLGTIRNLECGEGVGLDAIIAISRALGRLNELNNLFPEPPAISSNLLTNRNSLRVKSAKSKKSTPGSKQHDKKSSDTTITWAIKVDTTKK